MKTTRLFLCAVLCGTMHLYATQHTVSNAVGGGAQFATIQSAIDAAQPNDTILVQGSSINYSSITLTKRLTIIGPGHHPTAIGALPAILNACYLNSDYDAASGSRLIGLRLSGINLTGSTPIDDFVVRNCMITGNIGIQNSTTNCVFEGNFITAGVTLFFYQGMELIFRNNLFSGLYGYAQIAQINAPVIFDHNTFISNTLSGSPFNEVDQATITNNIFYNYNLSTTGSYSNAFNGCVVMNNASFMCIGDLPGANNTGSNNLNGVDPLFVNYPAIPTDYSWLYDIHLQPGSSLLGAGSDGTQIGVYGGTYPFHQSGEPIGMPSMNTLTIDNVAVPLNGTLNVNFSAEQAE